MKKIIISLLIGSISLFAEVITLVPYYGGINYDSSASKSSKESSHIGGVYFNVGTLNYLFEVSYDYMSTSYKDKSLSDLKQNEITLAYSQYFNYFTYKLGMHHISTNDSILGDGITGSLSLGMYNYVKLDKYSSGVQVHYTSFKEGNEGIKANKTQITPYIDFYNVLGSNTSNKLNLKINYQVTDNSEEKNYISYELKNTFYYKDINIEISAFFGEMMTGVGEDGFVVYNTLDLLTSRYGVKLGYLITPNLNVNTGYSIYTLQEYQLSEEGQNSIFTTNINYRF